MGGPFLTFAEAVSISTSSTPVCFNSFSYGGRTSSQRPGKLRSDKRKGKKLLWREAKISLAHARRLLLRNPTPSAAVRLLVFGLARASNSRARVRAACSEG